MASDEFLSRIDEHMARANEHMARGNEHMARGNELMVEIRRQHELNVEAYKQGMELCAHLIERVDAMFARSVASIDRVIAQSFEMEREIRANTETIREHTESVRAMRDVILRFLDRLDQRGGPASAT